MWATYGLGPSRGLFKSAKYQVAEKILIELPPALHHLSLVVVDGPFTAFDPYGSSDTIAFRLCEKHESLDDHRSQEPIPEPYASLLNRPRLGADQLQPLRCDAKRFRAGRSGIE